MGAELPKQRIGAGVRPRELRPTTTDGPVQIIGKRASKERRQSRAANFHGNLFN
jgi:hypothetical protein